MQNLEAEFASLDCGDQEEEDCGDQEEEGDLSARLASLHLSTGPSHNTDMHAHIHTHTCIRRHTHTDMHAHAYTHMHAYTHTHNVNVLLKFLLTR